MVKGPVVRKRFIYILKSQVDSYYTFIIHDMTLY